MKKFRDISINNFKGFKDFELKNLKKFNFIVGDNNVGKSSFLEAAVVSEDFYKTAAALTQISAYRQKMPENSVGFDSYYSKFNEIRCFDIEKIDYNGVRSKINIRKYNYNELLNNEELQNKLLTEKAFEKVVSSKESVFDATDYDVYSVNGSNIELLSKYVRRGGYIPFIHSGFSFSNDLVTYYSRFILDTNSNYKVLEEDIRNVFADFEAFRVLSREKDRPEILVDMRDGCKNLSLSDMGDGFVKVLRYYLEMYFDKECPLFIDEIDNGIYYRNLKKFWPMFFNTAKRFNNQIFATTHSKECISSLVDYLKLNPELKDDFQVLNFRLNNKGNPFAVIYNFEELDLAIELGNEFR